MSRSATSSFSSAAAAVFAPVHILSLSSKPLSIHVDILYDCRVIHTALVLFLTISPVLLFFVSPLEITRLRFFPFFISFFFFSCTCLNRLLLLVKVKCTQALKAAADVADEAGVGTHTAEHFISLPQTNAFFICCSILNGSVGVAQ